MPSVPVHPLLRLRGKLAAPPPATAADRARWARAAARPVRVTDDAPDLGVDVPGMVHCADVASFPIPERTAAWFRSHGGARAVRRALQEYMRTHADPAAAPARRRSRRRRTEAAREA